MKRVRGYLLLEAAMAGIVVTVAIGTAMMLASHFRVSVTNASRRAEAAQIAEARLERFAAGDRTATFGPEAVPDHRGFRISGSAAAQPIGAGALSGSLQRVTVTVEYPVGGRTKTLSLERWVR